METVEVEEHECEFGIPKFKVVHMCSFPKCVEVRIGTKRGNWRKLTSDETLSLTVRMMEDIIVHQAMTIIHGKENGHKRALEVLGYA